MLTNNSNVLLKIGLVGFKKKKKMYIYIEYSRKDRYGRCFRPYTSISNIIIYMYIYIYNSLAYSLTNLLDNSSKVHIPLYCLWLCRIHTVTVLYIHTYGKS